ncbi:nucleotidyltransferase family protein [Mycolicibacterium confluentis]|uniref:cGAS/DncV-like nucleotidyltransferase C-terminal helical domain-containing protein n=1 Tax=Mycolicibacterium confluentis TaxID=28047 RepID=A0A7I7XR27_9MYCO|nr:hypothetical protein [Mycolicibacterium confluentis]MCV7322522.1 hypothetical protein [Mycolicibacterium confluentis]BBZ31737.1 hypothetical protein MCNF_03420 [Mycolicibacterium confluentis]
MTDWENWLRSAAKRPSDHETSKRDRTEREIRDALANYEPLRGKPYRVYAKGSYVNNTNVRLNFDVDIAVEYYGYFYYDLDFELKGQDKSVVGIVDSEDPYTREEFKADINAALQHAFGRNAISEGDIAYRVRENRTTLPADVVPCWEYRRYDAINICHVGSRVYPTSGGYKDNYPAIQLQNGRAKTRATNRRYKRMVRALKKLQTVLAEADLIDHEIPSYLVECIVYNVPNAEFNHSTYLADMKSVLAFVFNGTLSGGGSPDWHEVHELRYLFRGSDWDRTAVHALSDAAWEYIGFE